MALRGHCTGTQEVRPSARGPGSPATTPQISDCGSGSAARRGKLEGGWGRGKLCIQAYVVSKDTKGLKPTGPLVLTASALVLLVVKGACLLQAARPLGSFPLGCATSWQ